MQWHCGFAMNRPLTPSLTAVELSPNGFLPLLIVILLLISKNLSRARLRLGLRLGACRRRLAAGLNSMAVTPSLSPNGGEGGRRSGEGRSVPMHAMHAKNESGCSMKLSVIIPAFNEA